MRNISDKSCRENQNTRFVFGNFFFENCTVYELMWEKPCRTEQATDGSMAHAYCMLDTLSLQNIQVRKVINLKMAHN